MCCLIRRSGLQVVPDWVLALDSRPPRRARKPPPRRRAAQEDHRRRVPRRSRQNPRHPPPGRRPAPPRGRQAPARVDRRHRLAAGLGIGIARPGFQVTTGGTFLGGGERTIGASRFEGDRRLWVTTVTQSQATGRRWGFAGFLPTFLTNSEQAKLYVGVLVLPTNEIGPTS
jgi:hypothetical protein